MFGTSSESNLLVNVNHESTGIDGHQVYEFVFMTAHSADLRRE
jgi:hypothetical protein